MLDTDNHEGLPPLEVTNITTDCFIAPTQVVVTEFRKFWDQYGLHLDITPEGARLQIHQVMHLYGPMFFDGSRKPPFSKVTLTLDSDNHYTRGSGARRTIDVNDFVLLRLTETGQRRIKDFFPHNSPFKTYDDLTSMQFHTMAHFFGPETYPGDATQHILNNRIYIPKAYNLSPEKRSYL